MTAVFVCVEDDVVWRGKVYCRGEVYDGPWEESPVDQMGWGVRDPLPSENSPNDNLGLGGRSRMNWRKPTTTPEVEPVIAGYDLLHGEVIIDEAATEQREIDVDEVNRRLMPKPRKDEANKRQLEYLREAAPDQFADFLEQCPEEAERLGFLKRESEESAPEEVQDIPAELTHTPLVAAVEPTPPPAEEVEQSADQDLERLLKEEIAALNDGNEELLLEIRAKIEAAMR